MRFLKIIVAFFMLSVAVAQAKLWFTTKSAPAPAFTPASIAGLRVWLDFSDGATITKNGSNFVTAVADKSSNAYTFVGTGNPLYVANVKNGLSGIQFNGTASQLTATAGSDLQVLSASVIAMPTNAARQYEGLLASSNTPTAQLRLEQGSQNSLELYVWNLGPIADTGLNSFANNIWKRVLWTYDVFGNANAGPNLIYLNRVSSGSGNCSGCTYYTTPMTVGWDTVDHAYPFTGQMGEVIVYDHVLSLYDQIRLDNYLHDKWGFSDTPPAPPTETFTPTSPLTRQVWQRSNTNQASITVTGASPDGTSARARAVVRGGYAGTTTSWQSLTVSGGNVSGTISATAGFYDIEIEVYVATYLLSTATVARVGIGDVFLSGPAQSNGTDMYSPLVTTPANDAVNILASNGTWANAVDPVSVQDGTTLSSVWPALGDLIYAHTGFPVGLAVLGESNTFAADWEYPGTLFSRISNTITTLGVNNFRATLQNIGESDAANSTSQSSYFNSIKTGLDRINAITGRTVPCGIASSETHPNESTGAGVIAAQAQLAAYTGCFAGPNTDSLNNTYRYDTVHFNTGTGRDAHANLWYQALLSNGLIP